LILKISLLECYRSWTVGETDCQPLLKYRERRRAEAGLEQGSTQGSRAGSAPSLGWGREEGSQPWGGAMGCPLLRLCGAPRAPGTCQPPAETASAQNL